MRTLLLLLAALALTGCPESPYKKCVKRGEAYYKEIGSYPMLSDGREADKVIAEMCVNTNGDAFAEE